MFKLPWSKSKKPVPEPEVIENTDPDDFADFSDDEFDPPDENYENWENENTQEFDENEEFYCVPDEVPNTAVPKTRPVPKIPDTEQPSLPPRPANGRSNNLAPTIPPPRMGQRLPEIPNKTGRKISSDGGESDSSYEEPDESPKQKSNGKQKKTVKPPTPPPFSPDDDEEDGEDYELPDDDQTPAKITANIKAINQAQPSGAAAGRMQQGRGQMPPIPGRVQTNQFRQPDPSPKQGSSGRLPAQLPPPLPSRGKNNLVAAEDELVYEDEAAFEDNGRAESVDDATYEVTDFEEEKLAAFADDDTYEETDFEISAPKNVVETKRSFLHGNNQIKKFIPPSRQMVSPRQVESSRKMESPRPVPTIPNTTPLKNQGTQEKSREMRNPPQPFSGTTNETKDISNSGSSNGTIEPTNLLDVKSRLRKVQPPQEKSENTNSVKTMRKPFSNNLAVTNSSSTASPDSNIFSRLAAISSKVGNDNVVNRTGSDLNKAAPKNLKINSMFQSQDQNDLNDSTKILEKKNILKELVNSKDRLNPAQKLNESPNNSLQGRISPTTPSWKKNNKSESVVPSKETTAANLKSSNSFTQKQNFKPPSFELPQENPKSLEKSDSISRKGRLPLVPSPTPSHSNRDSNTSTGSDSSTKSNNDHRLQTLNPNSANKQSVSQVALPQRSVSPVALPRRSLPPVPTSNIEQFGWFYSSVDRKEAELKLKLISQDGCFLVRNSQRGGVNNPYTLTLMYKNANFNLLIRKRADQKFALGFEKVDEHVFGSVSEMISFHQNNGIELIGDRSKNIPAGKVILTNWPK